MSEFLLLPGNIKPFLKWFFSLQLGDYLLHVADKLEKAFLFISLN